MHATMFLGALMAVSVSAATKTIISTKDAPAAIGPYSQAVKVSGADSFTLYVSGQIGLMPNGTMVGGGITNEANQALTNIQAIIKAGGGVMTDIVECLCLLADMSEYAAFNSVYAKFFTATPPARAAFQTALPKSARVEIKCTAVHV